MCQIENIVRATPADTPADQLLQAFLPFMLYISMHLPGSFRHPDYLPEFPVLLYHEMGLEQLLPVPRKMIKVIPVQFIPVLLYIFSSFRIRMSRYSASCSMPYFSCSVIFYNTFFSTVTIVSLCHPPWATNRISMISKPYFLPIPPEFHPQVITMPPFFTIRPMASFCLLQYEAWVVCILTVIPNAL